MRLSREAVWRISVSKLSMCSLRLTPITSSPLKIVTAFLLSLNFDTEKSDCVNAGVIFASSYVSK